MRSKSCSTKYKQSDYLTGDISHKMVTYGNQCMALADKFIALGSLPDAKLLENIDLVKELFVAPWVPHYSYMPSKHFEVLSHWLSYLVNRSSASL